VSDQRDGGGGTARDDAGESGSGGPVGSVGEEAAKLLHALQDWAADNGSDYAEAMTSAGSGAASAVHSVNEHIATGGPDCVYCPLCQVIGAVRKTNPEVKEHLAAAASSLLQAASGLLATHVPESGTGARGQQGTVEHIDLSDDGWEDE
jgi:hypothetical protein